MWDNGQPLTYTNWRKGAAAKYQDNRKRRKSTGIALDFYAKKVDCNPSVDSPFLSAVKMAIIEKDKKNIRHTQKRN